MQRTSNFRVKCCSVGSKWPYFRWLFFQSLHRLPAWTDKQLERSVLTFNWKLAKFGNFSGSFFSKNRLFLLFLFIIILRKLLIKLSFIAWWRCCSLLCSDHIYCSHHWNHYECNHQAWARWRGATGRIYLFCWWIESGWYDFGYYPKYCSIEHCLLHDRPSKIIIFHEKIP